MSKIICVVDDQPSLRQMLRFALAFEGVSVIEAGDGSEALEQISAHHVDMLIVDWQMPVIDGLELVRRLRKMDAYANLPIVIISCREDLAARKEARSLGVMTWLKKPFRISEIQLVVESILETSDRNRFADVSEGYC